MIGAWALGIGSKLKRLHLDVASEPLSPLGASPLLNIVGGDSAVLDREFDNLQVTHLKRTSSNASLDFSCQSNGSNDSFFFHSLDLPPPLLTNLSLNTGGRSLAQLPPELLLRIMGFLPTSTLAALLLTCTNISLVASTILSERSHYINTLEDLRSFTHDIPFHLIPWASATPATSPCGYSKRRNVCSQPFHIYFSHQLKKKQIGPIFYRAGTMLLFARHFTRLIPEARVLLGVGYAMILVWFMCIFYVVPFLGALTLYFAMDLVDLFIRSTALFIHSLPLTLLCFILPNSHPLHPHQPPEALRVPALLIRRLKFAAAFAPIIAGQSEPLRCCGLAGTAWDLDAEEIDCNVDTTITGQLASSNLVPATSTTPPLTETNPTQLNTTNNQAASTPPAKHAPFWGLMSSYTPWHLYLLTHTLSLHPQITHITLSRISLAWWFRLHPVPQLQVLILHSCELDETGIGLVAHAFPGLLGIVLRGSEVRCGGWDMESIRRGSSSTNGRLLYTSGPQTLVDAAQERDEEPERRVARGWWSCKQGAISFHNTDQSLSVFKSLRVVRFEMCAASCAVDAVRMVLDRCPTVERIEFVGCGVEEEIFLEGTAGGVVEWERATPDRTGCETVDCKQSVLWWEGQKRFKEKIEDCIKSTQDHLDELKKQHEEMDPTESSDTEWEGEQFVEVLVAPKGFRKCIVIQGNALNGLRDKWYVHVKTRHNGLWGHM
ncbi:UNVERIFIED_CONTAM: hypothetical protein HDU68_006048 [Siphonaria sp. JEL0065]|nr:hypothetical protein HDU68_006048 [Siphonaria sp. JEL0065]